ncbi:hypothetical protein SMACR_07584 [Sordaria macrospora]|uniref:WGS project CABT00000000 data, contig 2.27 n=2 Tax=Sordaria macrospora TaxID=5147 RepID=F7W4A6_SORMK|nr:uncharacterized protein SMAC_07584 [Sordaria macrospora k-hell]KAA8634931.1 hypothetical protein SMACR_07584 [Sordaria macrospora]KAH7635424.1 hypothetical protein B0T09DRAFT_22894 [Sordaria sp. MPI-SDFR-AT-0083]WPJ67359.1 hypothetical protein SMAC4_07584 [Sordaria macrospora]CCC14859.1 unnamed protein product [Sordaria macrospora k-hell]
MGSLRTTVAILGLCLFFFFTNVATAEEIIETTPIDLNDALEGLPQCALSCLIDTINSVGTCGNVTQPRPDLGDCVCHSRQMSDVSAACIHGACTVKESLTAKNITSFLCHEPIRKNNTVIPVLSVFIGLALLAVILRVLARLLTKAYFWWDDLCNLFAFIGCISFTALNIKSVDHGYGIDIWFVKFDDITMVLRLFFANMLLYTISRFFVRASIILFYLRVFPSDNKLSRILIWTMAFNVVYNVSFLFAVIFQCHPVQDFWLHWSGEHEGQCGNVQALVWSAAATGIVYDIWLLVLPFPQLFALNLHWKKKIMGSLMFSVGAAIMIISLIRLKTIPTFTRAENPTKDIVDLCIWSGIEIDVGVICPCLPSMRLLFRKLLPSILGTTDRYELEPVSANAGTAINRSLARKSKPMFNEPTTTDHGLHTGHDGSSIGTKFTHDDDHSQRHAASSESVTELVTDSDEDFKRMGSKV